MIEVEHLTKHYGTHVALDDVTFRVEKGEIVGFLGPNGAGKTTAMRILACFMPATSGRARVAGYDVFDQSLEVRKRIGYLPESVPLYPNLSVGAYLEFVAEIKGLGRSERRGRVASVMEQCRITDVQGKLIGRLSKGYRQRVGLAQALINDPEILVLDEPTLGLDPKQIIQIRQLIKALAGQHTVILSTHILPEVSMVCSRVIIINQGRIAAVDTPENLTAQLSGSARMVLHVAGPPVEVARALREVGGVMRVEQWGETADGMTEFLVETDPGRDVRADLARAVVGHQWGLMELRPMGLTLEDIFIRLVTEEAQAEAAGGEASVGGEGDHA